MIKRIFYDWPTNATEQTYIFDIDYDPVSGDFFYLGDLDDYFVARVNKIGETQWMNNFSTKQVSNSIMYRLVFSK